MIAFHESACSDAYVGIETRRDEKEREYAGAKEKKAESVSDVARIRERSDKNEARPYFRVTVALPSVSWHRLCASRCIPPILPRTRERVYVCTMQLGVFIFGRRAEWVWRWCSRAHLPARMRTYMHTNVSVCVQKGSVVPAVLLFGTTRRVIPGQCVVKKPYVRRALRTGVRATKREETREKGGEEEQRDDERSGGKEGDANVHGVSHMHARVHTRTHPAENAFAMRTTVECRVRCQTGLRLLATVRSRSNTSEFFARREFSRLFPLFVTTTSKYEVRYSKK